VNVAELFFNSCAASLSVVGRIEPEAERIACHLGELSALTDDLAKTVYFNASDPVGVVRHI